MYNIFWFSYCFVCTFTFININVFTFLETFGFLVGFCLEWRGCAFPECTINVHGMKICSTSEFNVDGVKKYMKLGLQLLLLLQPIVASIALSFVWMRYKKDEDDDDCPPLEEVN